MLDTRYHAPQIPNGKMLYLVQIQQRAVAQHFNFGTLCVSTFPDMDLH